jgi:hypothetical protein
MDAAGPSSSPNFRRAACSGYSAAPISPLGRARKARRDERAAIRDPGFGGDGQNVGAQVEYSQGSGLPSVDWISLVRSSALRSEQIAVGMVAVTVLVTWIFWDGGKDDYAAAVMETIMPGSWRDIAGNASLPRLREVRSRRSRLEKSQPSGSTLGLPLRGRVTSRDELCRSRPWNPRHRQLFSPDPTDEAPRK